MFITLTELDYTPGRGPLGWVETGVVVEVNPRLIESLTGHEGNTCVRMQSRSTLHVKETVAEIKAMMAEELG